MPSPFQQQSMQRKLIYALLIPALLSVSLLFRNYVMERWAGKLALREQSLGEVELTGSALRLTLTGASGFAVTGLWWAAIEAQKKHEWNELELLVRSVIKLQPHFVTPWLFQSWNLSYNVAVESDRVNDKYYYVTRGIELLSQGERQNRLRYQPAAGDAVEVGHPDMRFYLGFYHQHKIGLSDEANTMRSLFQLSCIDPRERDPDRFRPLNEKGQPQLEREQFEQFCQRHPFLVRRLRDSLRCETPEDVIDFLQANKDVPSRYEPLTALTNAGRGATPLLPPEKQFPVLPPAFTPDELTAETATLPESFDNYHVARAWFAYAQRPLPPPDPIPSIGNQDFDRNRYRLPRYMSTIIFRGYPARGQSYVADAFQKEGWFDKEGWLIKNWFPDDKFRSGRDAIVGDAVNWSLDAWSKAHNMWRGHGESNGLYLTPERITSLRDVADLYVRTFGQDAGIPGELPPEHRTPEMQKSLEAYSQLFWYERNRSMTNFPHFYYRSLVEAKEETVKARKTFFKAEEYRRAADYPKALELYTSPEGLPAWRKLLLENPDFRNDGTLQEDTYEMYMKYINLLSEDKQYRQTQHLLLVLDYLTQATLRPPLSVMWLPPVDMVVLGWLDFPDHEGQPLIPLDAVNRVRSRLGLPMRGIPETPPPTPESMLEQRIPSAATVAPDSPPKP